MIILNLQICIEGRPIASKIGAKSAFWSVEGEAVKVEDLALQHYAAEEQGSWQGTPLPVQPHAGVPVDAHQYQ